MIPQCHALWPYIVRCLDNLTHSLFGAILAQRFGRSTPHATLTLVLASNAPDIDAVTAMTGGSVGYLAAHRGPTHGPVGFVALAAVTAGLVFAWSAWRTRRRGESLPSPRRTLASLLGLSLIGVTAHALMDLPTSYGTRLLSPFVQTWYAFDWMPIIDVYLWAILIGGLAWCRLRRGAAPRIAVGVLMVMAVHYAGRAGLHQQALADGAAWTAQREPSPCAERPTLVRHPRVIEAQLAGPGACIQAAALPTFLSPFDWRIVRQYPQGYELSQRHALRRADPVDRVWVPSEAGPAIARARATTTGRVFFDFSRFPAARVVERGETGLVVRFQDVRFVGSPFRLEAEPDAPAPFTATIVLDASGGVVGEQLGN